MIIVMKPTASESEIAAVIKHIEDSGCTAKVDRGVERTIIGIRTARHDLQPESFTILAGVAEAVRINKPWRLASRQYQPTDTQFTIGSLNIGPKHFAVIAGPCSVETPEQVLKAAQAVKNAGATALRGGAFKPRSSPYAFQGMGIEGLKWLSEAGKATGLSVVTEVMHPGQIDAVASFADIIQIGARNMQNYDLLKSVGASRKPSLLKRGLSATLEEFLLSAEYLLDAGCDRIILCERGIRTFEQATRNTLDISAVPVLKDWSHLPVIIDPSHAVGIAKYVPSLTMAALAVGADGVMIEVHHDPKTARCDGQQSLNPDQFTDLMQRIRTMAELVGRII